VLLALRKAGGATAPRLACEHFQQKMTSRWAPLNAKILRRGWAPPEDFCGLELIKPRIHPSTPPSAELTMNLQKCEG
jgi:hypothetical protein